MPKTSRERAERHALGNAQGSQNAPRADCFQITRAFSARLITPTPKVNPIRIGTRGIFFKLEPNGPSSKIQSRDVRCSREAVLARVVPAN
jgi:hypothetical protein